MSEPTHVPLWLKLAYSAFMAILIPVYWYNYGPTNFLYFCDMALILTLVGIWVESPLLVSMCTIGIVVPQVLWVIDFLSHLAGEPLTGVTNYMFRTHYPLFLRGLSLFHGWMPFLLVFLVWRLGYDRRAFPIWTALVWSLVLICFFFMPPPQPNPGMTPVNINGVWGLSDNAPQTWVSQRVWLAGLIVGLPALLFAPVHFLLAWTMPNARHRPPQARAASPC